MFVCDTFRYKTISSSYKSRIKISLAPNISYVCYGRTVGYKVEKIKMPKKIESISATKIRKNLRSLGKLKKIKINEKKN